MPKAAVTNSVVVAEAFAGTTVIHRVKGLIRCRRAPDRMGIVAYAMPHGAMYVLAFLDA
jgi:hypothetical protein